MTPYINAFLKPAGTEIWAYSYKFGKDIVKPIFGVLTAERTAIHGQNEISDTVKYFVPYKPETRKPMFSRAVQAHKRKYAEDYDTARDGFNEMVEMHIYGLKNSLRDAQNTKIDVNMIPEPAAANNKTSGPLTRTRKIQLALKLIELLNRHYLWDGDIAIYYDNTRITPYKPPQSEIQAYGPCRADKTDNGVPFYMLRGIEPTPDNYNTNTLTMTFENPLYDILRDDIDSDVVPELTRLFQSYDLYYEQDHAWDLSLYPIE